MNTQTAQVDGRSVQYSTVRMLLCQAPLGQALLPHPQGQFFAVLCRECGFGVLGLSEEQAAHYMLATMNGLGHGHELAWPCSPVQFDPQLIDHIYEAFNPEGKTA